MRMVRVNARTCSSVVELIDGALRTDKRKPSSGDTYWIEALELGEWVLRLFSMPFP